MAAWYGLDMGGLSACNWFDYFLIPYPGGDERWHVRGGNDLVTRRAAARLPDGVLHLQQPLEAVRRLSDGGYELHYDHLDYLPYDPDDRDAYLAIGAFLETLDLAAQRHGHGAVLEPRYLRDGSDLSLPTFHDGLRRLQERRALRLQTADEPAGLPRPEFALLDAGRVFYYVSL